jgi:hypothetical protein
VRTSFSQANWDLTKAAHLAAQTQVYPRLWPNATKLQFVDKTKSVMDLEYAIDCIAAVSVEGLKRPLKFFIQERFREVDYSRHYSDVTVTEMNVINDLPSELHKIAAHYLVYGYYDKNTDEIVDAVVVNVAQMLTGIAEGVIRYIRKPRKSKDQTFIAIEFDELERNNALTITSLKHSQTVEAMTDFSRWTPEEHKIWGL